METGALKNRREEFYRVMKKFNLDFSDKFVLYLSFLGWDLLSLLTLGILEIVYVAPYKAAAVAGFYDAIKGE